MFIVGIFAGLASQMNQYAFLLLLKRHYPNVDIKMAVDSDWKKHCDHNGYELDHVFGIQKDGADLSMVARLADFHLGEGVVAKVHNAFYQLCDKLFGRKKTQIGLRNPAVFEERVLSLPANRDFLFWCNWSRMIYSEVETEIREAFRFVRPIPDRLRTLCSQMAEENSVAVHLRRGDYVKFGFDLLGGEYYSKAVEIIEQRVRNPRYFVFSDDISCAKEVFSFIPDSRKVFVEGNRGKDSYLDMQLMSLCRHNITANSGFSFWGAWLNNNPSKVVVTPACPDSGPYAATARMGWIQI